MSRAAGHECWLTRCWFQAEKLLGSPKVLNGSALYTLELTRKSKVVSWDSRMYDDCNRDEAESASLEHEQASVRYDVDRISLPEILAIEDDRRGTCDMVADLYMSGKDIWESAESAEKGAQEAIASALKRVRSGDESNFELASQEMMDEHGDSMDKTKVPDFGGEVTRSVRSRLHAHTSARSHAHAHAHTHAHGRHTV